VSASSPSDLVFAFMRPHQPGTICGFPCEQCGAGKMGMQGALCERLPDTPLLILAEATESDWRESVKRGGGEPREPSPYAFFYLVTCD
jgi:hypothetical protein